jgi:hypothetical protein
MVDVTNHRIQFNLTSLFSLSDLLPGSLEEWKKVRCLREDRRRWGTNQAGIPHTCVYLLFPDNGVTLSCDQRERMDIYQTYGNQTSMLSAIRMIRKRPDHP